MHLTIMFIRAYLRADNNEQDSGRARELPREARQRPQQGHSKRSPRECQRRQLRPARVAALAEWRRAAGGVDRPPLPLVGGGLAKAQGRNRFQRLAHRRARSANQPPGNAAHQRRRVHRADSGDD